MSLIPCCGNKSPSAVEKPIYAAVEGGDTC